MRRYLVLALSLALGLPLLLLATPQRASAATIYDDILGTTGSLPVACRGGDVIDMSEDWFSHMLAASPTNPTLLKLQEKLDNGETSGWAVKASRNWSNTPAYAYDTVTLYVTSEDADYTLDTYNGPESGYYNIHGMTFIGADYVYAYTYYTYYQSDAATCGRANWYSNGGLKYDGTTVLDASPGYVLEVNNQNGRVLMQDYSDKHFLFINAPFIAPNEYEGIMVPSEYTPPIPVPYSGTVDCGGESPLAMIIEQGNNDGEATLTPTSLGRADWEYDLTTEPYAIAVLCGETWAVSYTSVYSASTSGDWVCDPYTPRYDQAYCVLS